MQTMQENGPLGYNYHAGNGHLGHNCMQEMVLWDTEV